MSSPTRRFATSWVENGLDPAPERNKKTTWKQFLRSHCSTLAATDFFTTEIWTGRGLVTMYTLFVIELKSRRVHIVGSTAHPNAIFMKQAALELVAFDGSFRRGKTHLILDGDAKFTAEFKEIPSDANVKAVRIPPRSPNCNAYAERFVLDHQERSPEQAHPFRPRGAGPIDIGSRCPLQL